MPQNSLMSTFRIYYFPTFMFNKTSETLQGGRQMVEEGSQ